MKTNILLLVLALMVTRVLAAEDPASILQKALFEEEANRNISAAMEGYQKVIAQFDDQRKLAATAIFRLAECYRKQGNTNAATAQYQRILNEFADQGQLVNTSRERLGQQQPAASVESGAPNNSSDATEIALWQGVIKDSPDLINAPLESGLTPLEQATSAGKESVVEFLLAHGANIEAGAGGTGRKALQYAVEAGNKRMCELLLAKGADVNARDNQALSALHLAAMKGFRSIAELLLDKGAEINAQDKNGVSPLHLAVEKKFKAITELLLAKGARVDLISVNDGTPLFVAVRNNDVEVMQVLIAHKANVNARNRNAETALHVAADMGATEAARMLIQHGAQVNAGIAENKNWTPLWRAISKGRGQMVALLLENGAEPNLQVDRSDTLLGQAIQRGAPDIVEELLNHKADPNFGAGIPPLIKVLDARGPATRQMVSLLLDHGADPNLAGINKTTPLMYACLHPDEEIVAALLAHKADVNAQDKDGRSALFYLMNRASDPNALPVAKQLLAAGADANLKDDTGQSALTLKASGDGLAKIKALFEAQPAK